MSSTSIWSRRDVVLGRLLFWTTVLVYGGFVSGASRDRASVLFVWAATIVTVAVLHVVADQPLTRQASLPWGGWAGSIALNGPIAALLVEILGLSLLVRLTGGAASDLRFAYPFLILAAFGLLDERTAARISLVALAAALLTLGIDLLTGPTESATIGAIGLMAVVLGGAILFGYRFRVGLATEAQRAAAAEIRRALDRGIGSARSEVLLSATNQFLRAGDLEELARTILDSCRAMFDPSKAIITFRSDEGHLRVAASHGLDAGEMERVRRALEERPPLVIQAESGEVWSDELEGSYGRERMAAYGARSGFSMPITSPGLVVGTLAVLYREERLFDETFRDTARNLAAQAALAVELLEARTELRRGQEALELAVVERTRQLNDVVVELRAANQVKTEFLANVSHELRTPLTAILGFSDLLLEEPDGALNEEQQQDLRTINQSSRHLLKLIDDLIDISSIEAGRMELRTERIAFLPQLERAIADVRPSAGRKGIGLKLAHEDLPNEIEADPERLREILVNLLSNAVKFTPARGTVRVLARGIPPDHVRIEVIDTGIGIAEEDQARVFERFHRVAGPKYPGTGLGLPIARELAGLHGGELVLESTLGLGSRFILILPLHDASRGTPPNPTASTSLAPAAEAVVGAPAVEPAAVESPAAEPAAAEPLPAEPAAVDAAASESPAAEPLPAEPAAVDAAASESPAAELLAADLPAPEASGAQSRPAEAGGAA